MGIGDFLRNTGRGTEAPPNLPPGTFCLTCADGPQGGDHLPLPTAILWGGGHRVEIESWGELMDPGRARVGGEVGWGLPPSPPPPEAEAGSLG